MAAILEGPDLSMDQDAWNRIMFGSPAKTENEYILPKLSEATMGILAQAMEQSGIVPPSQSIVSNPQPQLLLSQVSRPPRVPRKRKLVPEVALKEIKKLATIPEQNTARIATTSDARKPSPMSLVVCTTRAAPSGLNKEEATKLISEIFDDMIAAKVKDGKVSLLFLRRYLLKKAIISFVVDHLKLESFKLSDVFDCLVNVCEAYGIKLEFND